MFRFYLSAFYVDLKGSLHLFNLSDFILLMFILIWAPVVGYFQFWLIPLSVVGGVVLCYVVWRWMYRPPDEPQKNGAKPSLSAGEAEGKGCGLRPNAALPILLFPVGALEQEGKGR